MWRSQPSKLAVGAGIVAAVGAVAVTTFVLSRRKPKRTKIIEMVRRKNFYPRRGHRHQPLAAAIAAMGR